MQNNIFDICGVVGTILIIGTYILLQSGKVKSEDLIYSVLNALGAFLIVISLIYSFNLSAFIVEVFWVLISIYGIVRYFLRSKNKAKENLGNQL